ncbi:unnamed protein product [Mytilus coruscus]|uniref:Uncharacterized protein n=1 Tax=Mytilus coruscus TaxID=42192 RepID=A0A6J8CK97_MYTCO|nr:unnamed protein product [Mytilus coruscus]
MPSKPTGQEANTCFDEHLTLRDQHTDQAAGQIVLKIIWRIHQNQTSRIFCNKTCKEYSSKQLLICHDSPVSDDSDERRNKLAKANNLSSGQAVLSTKTNIDAKQRSSSIIDASNLYIEPSEHSLTESTSPNSNIPKSNKTVLENCYYSNHVHIGSVHKSEKKIDTSAENDNKQIRREEISTAKKSDETLELLEKGTSEEKHIGRPTMISFTFNQLIVVVVVAVVVVVVILALVLVVIFLCTRNSELGLTKNTSSERTNDIKSSTLYVNWVDTNTVDSTQNVNITWLLEKQNRFISVERDIININFNGTYELYLSLNIDIPNVKRNATNKSIRYISLICLKTNRYENLCQRHRSLPNTASTVPIKGVFPLWEGDKIWVSVTGMNQIYKMKDTNRLVITKYPL